MEAFLLAKILAALEWQNQNSHSQSIFLYIDERYQEILTETLDEFHHLYLEL